VLSHWPRINPPFLGQVEPKPQFHFIITATFSRIWYGTWDGIMTWSMRRLNGLSRSFTSRFEICDPTNIGWITVKKHHILCKIRRFLIATQQILVQSKNLTAGGGRAAKSAQGMYWSCYNTIRTQILNWSQNCELEMPGWGWWNRPLCNGPGCSCGKTHCHGPISGGTRTGTHSWIWTHCIDYAWQAGDH